MRGVGAELRGERRARGVVEDLINVGGRDAVGLLEDGGGDADGPRDGTRASPRARVPSRGAMRGGNGVRPARTGEKTVAADISPGSA